MGLSLVELTPVHDTFHGIIPGQLSTPIRCIDLEESCGTWDNKRRKMLMFEVVSFDIGYNCILGRPFLLKFMVVIHTAYATIKMSGLKGVITIKSDQRDALTCENAALMHAGRFGAKVAEEQAAKVAKTHGGSTPIKSPAPKPPTSGTPWLPPTKKSTYVASGSNQQPANQHTNEKKKGGTNKEVPADLNGSDKKI
jgi:hypothetical protein